MHTRLNELWWEATRHAAAPGLALATVGSLARGELGPCSDLDLVLLHDASVQPGDVPDRVWYPLWDERVRIDHSVRTPDECLTVAATDLAAAVGLLDLRPVAGDAGLVGRTRARLTEAWRRSVRGRLDDLTGALAEREQRSGAVAHLLEPDLKEGRGGLRDVVLLRALVAGWLIDLPHTGLEEHHRLLLDVRDAVQVTTGRASDRLVFDEMPAVARLLGVPEPDELRMAVSLAARHVAYALDVALRTARQASRHRTGLRRILGARGPRLTSHPFGLIVADGEVGLAAGTDPSDPVVALRAAGLAAGNGLMLSPTTATNLGRHARPVPPPWPDAAREALVDLLASGPGLVSAWEALDLAGCVAAWIPAWQAIRCRPQHSPLHRHTVDRHTITAVAGAAPFLTAVARPDLLVLAVLLHDIGKIGGGAGTTTPGPADWLGRAHAEVGAPIAQAVMADLGYPPADVAVVARLVRHHLTLAELATRRDHDDPATTDTLVAAVDGSAETLRLLRCLTEADARAAGPAAWSAWRARLINDLTDRTLAVLSGEALHAPAQGIAEPELVRSVAADGRPQVSYDVAAGGTRITTVSMDRLGLFADVAGLLAVHRLPVRAAVLETVPAPRLPSRGPVPGVAVNVWQVDAGLAELPDESLLAGELARLAGGDRTLLDRLQRREDRTHTGAPPVVRVLTGASGDAAVVEVRARDRPGLLWALGRAITEAGSSVRSAHISTLAGSAIDTFYLTASDGSPPTAALTEHTRRRLADAAG